MRGSDLFVSAGSLGGAPLWDHGLRKGKGESPGTGTRHHAGRSGGGRRSPRSLDTGDGGEGRSGHGAPGSLCRAEKGDTCPFSSFQPPKKSYVNYKVLQEQIKEQKAAREEAKRTVGVVASLGDPAWRLVAGLAAGDAVARWSRSPHCVRVARPVTPAA